MTLDELLLVAQADKPGAERELFRRIRAELVGYFRSRVPASEVEDLVQRSLEIIAREWGSFTPKSSGAFRSHVFAVAFNRLRTYRHEQTRRREELGEPGELTPAPDPSPDEAVLWEERGSLLREALGFIRKTYRRVVESRLRDDTPAAFAKSEKVAVSTLYTRFQRARDAIRAEIWVRRQTRERTPT